MFCVDLFLILSTSFRSASAAKRKGHSGTLFGLLHALVVIAAEIAGIATGLLLGFYADPHMDRNSATGPILMGAAGGIAFGVVLMFLVVGMLPARDNALSERPSRTRVRIGADS